MKNPIASAPNVLLACACAALLFSSSVLAAPKCGGSGGNNTRTFTCGAGAVINAIEAMGAGYLHYIKVRCSDGKVSSRLGVTNRPPGAFSGKAECSSTQGVIGIDAYCGIYADSIRTIECGSKFGGVWSVDGAYKTLNVGGKGGNRTDMACARGKAAYGIRVKYGLWMDSFEIFCR